MVSQRELDPHWVDCAQGTLRKHRVTLQEEVKSQAGPPKCREALTVETKVIQDDMACVRWGFAKDSEMETFESLKEQEESSFPSYGPFLGSIPD